MDCSYFLPPSVLDFCEEKVHSYGSGFAGALFGAGWCFWADAVLVSMQHDQKVSFAEYIPGLIATFAMILMCTVRRSENGDDPFDSASFCRQRFWLFVAYVVSFSAVIGSCSLLIRHYQDQDGQPEDWQIWTGWASVLQVTSILGSGLLLFMAGSATDGYDDGFYTGF